MRQPLVVGSSLPKRGGDGCSEHGVDPLLPEAAARAALIEAVGPPDEEPAVDAWGLTGQKSPSAAFGAEASAALPGVPFPDR